MIKFRALVCSVIVGIVLTLSGSLPAWAATANKAISLTTSPVSTDLAGKPGSSVSTTLQVMNNSSLPLNITVQLDTFKASGTTGQAQIVTPKTGDDFIKWVTFSKNSFIAQPGVWNSVQMTINLPSYAALGYYYAVLFKPTIPNPAIKGTASLKGSNAILVLLNAESANEKAKIQVTSFTTSKKIYEYLPVDFSVNVNNNGNIYLPPKGDIYISHSTNFSKPIDVLSINPSQGNVLPGSSRVYKSQWVNGFPVFVPKTLAGQPVTNKDGTPISQLKWDFSQNNKFRFGKYYAKMVLVYSNGTNDVPITATVSFWVIPWKLIILFILFIAMIVGLVILVIYLTHKLKKKTQWKA